MQNDLYKKRILLAITGASGLTYASTLAQELSNRSDIELHIILSQAAQKVIPHEMGLDKERLDILALAQTSYKETDIDAPPASGSWIHAGMVVCPCSMASLAAIANGLSQNLIHRAADVTLKEGRKLILVPRETPLSLIHLKNMLAAKEAGAIILPACPGFYHDPQSITDLTAHLAGKILDQLNITNRLFERWKG